MLRTPWFLVVLGLLLSSFPEFLRGLSLEGKSRVLQLAGLSRSDARNVRSRNGYLMRQPAKKIVCVCVSPSVSTSSSKL